MSEAQLNLIYLEGVKNIEALDLPKCQTLTNSFPTVGWQHQAKILESLLRRLKRFGVLESKTSVDMRELEYDDPYETKDKAFAKLPLELRKSIIGEELQPRVKSVRKEINTKEIAQREIQLTPLSDYIMSFLEKAIPHIREERVLTGFNIFIHGSIPIQFREGGGEIIQRLRKLNEKLVSENSIYRSLEENFGAKNPEKFS